MLVEVDEAYIAFAGCDEEMGRRRVRIKNDVNEAFCLCCVSKTGSWRPIMDPSC